MSRASGESAPTSVRPLLKLLRSRDVDLVLQGVELAVGLDDPAVWAALLPGARWQADRPGAFGAGGPGLVVDGPLRPVNAARPHQDLAVTLLVAHAPLDEVKAAVTSLNLHGGAPFANRPTLQWLPVDGLDRFPNLRTLTLALSTRLGPLDAVGRCPSLASLTIVHDGLEPTVDLAGLGASTTLTELNLHGAPTGFATLPASLTTLTIDQRRFPVDLAGLGRASGLASLTVRGAYVDPTGLRGSPVRAVTVTGPLRAPLPTLRSLERLTLPSRSETQPTEVQPTVRWLTLHAVPSGPVAGWFPGVRHLTLVGVTAPDLAFLAGADGLETVVLSGCVIQDLSALATLPGLRGIGLHRTASKTFATLPVAANLDPEGAPSAVLDLTAAPLKTIFGADRLTGVTTVRVAHCGRLHSLEGLGPDVEVVDARYTATLTSAAALGRLRRPRLIALYGSGVGADDVPRSASRAVTLAPDPTFPTATVRD